MYAIVALAVALAAQSNDDQIKQRIKVAQDAAGHEHTALFEALCAPPAPPVLTSSRPAAAQPQGSPQRTNWHVEPVKVFDNLYYVGQSDYSAWAVTTSDGIIIVDTLYDYSVEDEIVNGLKKVGLDPANIKYAIVSHGHSDHAGGAKYLQDHFGTHIVMSAADWDLLDRDMGAWEKPKRDMIATDGQKLTLGDTTLTLYFTPGHTMGTISTLIPVKDNGTPHLVAEWGGTAFNWLNNRRAYITSQRPDRFWFETYIDSARRFRDVVTKAGADVLISNHPNYDDSKRKLALLSRRGSGSDHPYVVGRDAVQRYLRVAENCAGAGLMRLK
jgi:metallo-beta-lactamase class B